ncbi:MAG TPA: T9SS type A sorting domain-containing protein [Bacteroidales bacterium]|nr:T9SS type A sorting domain-containing protein [Bacteroidales bacterium]HOR60795.1 T9SS type A sorting domain-containing protein [Bacteroidales bacterium]
MKKTLLTLFSVIVLGSLTFAQIDFVPKKLTNATPNEPSYTDEQVRSAWVGGGFTYYYNDTNPGDEFYIVGSEFSEFTVGSQITKVKFFHQLGEVAFGEETVNFTNTSYTVKIYENPTLTPLIPGYSYYNTDIGTPIFTQTVVLDESTSNTFHELELTTPYIVNENDFWVALVFDNGVGAMRLGDANPANEGKYYMYAASPLGGNLITPTAFQDGIYALGISLYLDDGGAYEESSDIQAFFLTSMQAPYTPVVTSATVAEGQDLVLNPAFQNNGPDGVNGTITISMTAGGTEIFNSGAIDNFTLANGYFGFVFEEPYTLTSEAMDQLNLGTNFDVCMTVTYSGTDPNLNNNTACVAVTRTGGSTPSTNCDLEAIFMKSNTDPSPIATTMTLEPEDGITVYPGVRNLGPDAANTTATITFTVNGTTMDTQQVDLTGLAANQVAALTQSGLTVSAEDLNSANLTGTFEGCMTITYAGNDPVAANNTTCITITRKTDVEENLANKITLYPNPANNFVSITNAENANITIINMIGEVVANVNNASSNQTIDISKLANGTYFVKVDNKVFKLNVIK